LRLTPYTPRMSFQSFFKYLKYSSRDEEWGLYCVDVGAVEIKPGERYPYRADAHPAQYTMNWQKGRILNEYQFLYIAKGEGVFHGIDGVRSLREGSFVCLVPGVWHYYHPTKECGWIEYWVGFKGDFADHFRKYGFLGENNRIIEVGKHELILGHFNRILECVKGERPGYQQIVSSLIPHILAEAVSLSNHPSEEARGKEIFDSVTQIFEANLFGNLDMESLADSLNLSYSTFREEFKHYTHLSPYQYFLQMKINKAKEMLFDGLLSVKEISYKLSFENPYYFSRLFKIKTGIPPSQWHGIETSED